MLANNNLKVCWTLAKRDFRFHRAKNGILALAAKRDFRFHRAKNCILALAVALVTGL